MPKLIPVLVWLDEGEIRRRVERPICALAMSKSGRALDEATDLKIMDACRAALARRGKAWRGDEVNYGCVLSDGYEHARINDQPFLVRRCTVIPHE